jgi:HEPN domain-containing protein
MTIEEKIQYWVGISDYDMETAVTMLRSKRYLYVGFMCHQVVEKIFNIEARYPEYKKNIAQTLNYTKCEAMIEQTKTLQQWIKETILLPK